MNVKKFDEENNIVLWYKSDHKLCEECIWYNDCELTYACPPLQLLQRNRE